MNANKIIAVNVAPNPHRITAKLKNRKIREISSLIKELPAMFNSLLNDYKWLSSSNDEVKASSPRETQIKPPTLTRVLLQSISISTNNLMLQHLRYARPDVLIEPKIEEFDMLEFYKGPRIIKYGYDEAVNSLPLIKNEIAHSASDK
jgi:predicted acylesterase/phospholipase RssA